MSVTIKDIARETGLSLATISKYLNGGNLREKNRAAIEAAIKKLDYHVNEYARGLKSKKSRTVGVVLPEISNLFNMKIVAVFERVLQENGYSVIVTDCQNNLEQEASSVDFLLKKQVDGIINVPIGSSSRHLRPAVEKKVPILLLDRPLEDLNGVASCVLIDNRGAARLGVRRLLQAGHRRIGGAGGSDEVHTAQMRCGATGTLGGIRRGVRREPGAPVRPHLGGGLPPGPAAAESQHRHDRHVPHQLRFDAGRLIALNERGVQIPGEMSVVGFDNIMDLSRVFRPSLTIVSQPLEQIGLQAARLMLDQLSGGKDATPMTINLSRFPKRGRLGGGTPAQP